MNENTNKRKYTSKMRSAYLQDYKKPTKPEPIPWSQLPSTAVIAVLQCLKDNDKIAMSEVNINICLKL